MVFAESFFLNVILDFKAAIMMFVAFAIVVIVTIYRYHGHGDIMSY